jgi:signal transduction histidine kinase
MAEQGNTKVEPVSLNGVSLGRHPHVCAFFQDEDEEYRILIPFIVEGFRRGEKAVHIVNPRLFARHLERLQASGIDVNQARQSGQLEVRSWEEVYLRDGHFESDRMLAFISGAIAEARAKGFPRTRIVGYADWVVEDHPGVDGFLRYESLLNRILLDHDDPVICVFDSTKFSGRMVIDIVRTHPTNILGGILQEQPFFTPASELLRELEQWGTNTQRSPSAAQTIDPHGEVQWIPPSQLRNLIRDLLSVVTIPATWRGSDSSAIINSLLDMLTAVVRLDFALASVATGPGSGRGYFFKSILPNGSVRPEQLGRLLESQLRKPGTTVVANPFRDGSLRVVSLALGTNAKWGTVIAASPDERFPTQLEFLLLRIASNEAAMALEVQHTQSLETEKSRLESEKLRAAAALAQLHAHVEPHFFLNTLNAIAGLITADPRAARELLGDLGELLRESLRSEGEMQTLQEQIDWLRRYAHILEVRHSGRVVFRWQIEDIVRQVLVPRLLLQPLVENAVKHGVLRRERDGEIIVTGKLVQEEGEPASKLVFTVEDNGPGLPAGAPRADARGISSLQRYLGLKYGDNASLRLKSSPAGTKAIVELPADGLRRSR